MARASKISLGAKILLLAGVLFFLCTCLCAGIYWQATRASEREELELLAQQTLSSINDGILSQFSYVHNYAVTLFTEDSLQSAMEGNAVGLSLNIERALYKITQFSAQVETAYFLDSQRQQLYSVKRTGENAQLDPSLALPTTAMPQNATWRVLPDSLLGQGNTYVTMVFPLQSTSKFELLGYLMLEFDVNKLMDTYHDTLRRYDMDLQIKDASDDVVLPFLNGGNNSKNTMRTAWLAADNSHYTWQYTSVMSDRAVSGIYTKNNTIALMLLAINSVVLFWGIYTIVHRSLRPLKMLSQAMDKSDGRSPVYMQMPTDTQEILQLQNAFNRMVDRVEKMMRSIYEEQKSLRKMELNLLQAQINPHFLYNTLNDINALILTDRKQDAYQTMKSLGSFYRRTLSKGRESISLREELMITNDYLTVQKMRFGSAFELQIQTDEEALDITVPKMMLQPLVENAIYHGLRPLKRLGTLRITVSRTCQNSVKIVVADDGAGMDEEMLAKVLSGQAKPEKQSFGLRKTVERIRLYFGDNDCIKIHTEPGKGFEIVIEIKVNKEENSA